MLRDITFGQHFPGNSVLHRMDPRLKILVTIGYIVVLFLGTNPLGLGIATTVVVMAYAIAGIPARMAWRNLRPVLFILLFTGLLNLFFNSAGTLLVHWWIFTITSGGVYHSITMMIRIICLILGTSLLTYTTSPIVLTDAIERLLSPLSKLHFPAHELAMMMTIALRMIPTIIEETDKIMNAQKARGAQMDSGPLMQRIKALVPILIPLFLSAFRRADELAMAMECRCYHGGEGRTRLRQLKITGLDAALFLLCLAIFVMIGFSRRITPAPFQV